MIPGHGLGGLYHIVALERRQGNASEGLQPKIFGEAAIVFLDCLEESKEVALD